MADSSPALFYHAQVQHFSAKLIGLQKRRRQLGYARLTVFLLVIFVAIKAFPALGVYGLLPTLVGLGLLLYLVNLDARNNQQIRHTKTIVELNEEELLALDDRFTHRYNGEAFLPSDHAYAADLDLFGPASVFQLVNRCYTEQGQRLLADNLLAPASMPMICSRQEAVKEMAHQTTWRQQWQAIAMQKTVTLKSEQKFNTWMAEKQTHFVNRAWKPFVLLYTTMALGVALATVLDIIPVALFSTFYFFFLIVSAVLSRNTVLQGVQLDGVVKEAGTIQGLIDCLERANFTAPHLQQMLISLKRASAGAGKEIRSLKTILDRFDLRKSFIGALVFNPFLLWDVRQAIALNRWRERNRETSNVWFQVIGEMDLLHSFATLHFNRPDWCWPQITDAYFTLAAKAVGHPLLPDRQRVNNDFTLKGTAKVDLITGSNMAGKSTFLRSLGVNVVLAQIGSPLCAQSFVLSPLRLVSSMRIADNLAENTSTFYAELKKLRNIIDRVKLREPLFILLDEILRGTNSLDRHKGSAALIRQLIKEDAVAIIATHDVALAQLEQDFPQAVSNYHFDVEVAGEELYFDYRLKKGVCESLNATLLMKKIGIDLD